MDIEKLGKFIAKTMLYNRCIYLLQLGLLKANNVARGRGKAGCTIKISLVMPAGAPMSMHVHFLDHPSSHQVLSDDKRTGARNVDSFPTGWKRVLVK